MAGSDKPKTISSKKSLHPAQKDPLHWGVFIKGLGLYQSNLYTNLLYSSCPRTQKGGRPWPNNSLGQRLSYRDT